MIALLDGDIFTYRVACTTENEDEELVHQIACDSDSSYRRAITKLGRSCD